MMGAIVAIARENITANTAIRNVGFEGRNTNITENLITTFSSRFSRSDSDFYEVLKIGFGSFVMFGGWFKTNARIDSVSRLYRINGGDTESDHYSMEKRAQHVAPLQRRSD